MKQTLNLLVTGAGAPGIQGTIYSLRENYDQRKVHITGTDVKSAVVGQYLCDRFEVIPPAKETDRYLETLLDLCKRLQIDVVVPQNTMELLILSQHKADFRSLGTEIVVSDYQSIVDANDKANLFGVAQKSGVPTCRYGVCHTFDQLSKLLGEMNRRNGLAVVKPPLSNGSRGVRIVTEARDRKADFYNEKPSALYTTEDELYDVLGDEFPELMVMEYLPGDEYTVDVFRSGDIFYAIPRKREVIRSGITFTASLAQDERMIDYSRKLAEACGLTLCFGFQFKMNEDGVPILLESNPRVQGTMVMSTFCGANIIYSAVKRLLGETIPPLKVDWSTKLYRYWGAVGIGHDGVVKI